MNEAVIGLSVVVGLVAGGVVWWLKRSILAAVLVPIVIVAFVALALTPPGTRVTPPKSVADSAPGATQAEEELSMEAKLAAFRPIEVLGRGYVGSDACRDCHPQQHATWFASYHRTMTQVARPEVVLGDFNNVKLSQSGRDYHLKMAEDTCWVEMLDPAAIPGTPAALERVHLPIVMTTGSHHMQAYWFPVGVGRTLGILPFVFLNETQEWIPRSAAFLKPADEGVSHEIGRWNSACSKCHSTHPKVREMTPGEWDTRAAEFGISCEACHGQGEQHIAYRQGSVAGKQSSADASSDPIVNPSHLSHVRSSQICGQCHAGLTVKGDPSEINREGISFHPGTDLRETYDVWQLHSPEMKELLKVEAIHDRVVKTNRGTFYADGVVRVSGREYTSLEQSACFQRGEMGCMTCHQLHKSKDDVRRDQDWADDQLMPSAFGNDACIGCHDEEKYSTEHTHHASDSTGSNCYNCHMPHTAYGLLKAIRNHTISSPDLKLELPVERPSACNQCHLDKTLKWTADHLREWYAIEGPELDAEQSEVAASILWSLKGNAASRAMAAWTMGWPDAQAVSGNDWQSAYLARLLDDPYLAVRMIARRSLRTLPGLSEMKVNAFDSDAARRAVIDSVITHWTKQTHTANPALLIERDNVIDSERIEAIMTDRDDTPMTLTE